jgi:replicative DNA helicase
MAGMITENTDVNATPQPSALAAPPRTARPPRAAAPLFALDRVPPHNVEAEMAVLGSMLLSADAVAEVLKVVRKQHLEQGFFYHPPHHVIFQAIADLWDAHQPVDIVTVTQKLRDRGQLEQAGGNMYVGNLIHCVATAANVHHYLAIVREKFCLRRLIEVCTDVVVRSFEQREDVETLLDQTEQSIFDLNNDRVTASAKGMKELTKQTMEVVTDLIERRGALTGLPTGFKDLDRLTSGLQRAEMFIIAARPSMGKTALAMNIAEHVALDYEWTDAQGQRRRGAPVGVFSLEMSAQQLAMRLLCARARVNLRKLRDGFASKQDASALATVAGQLFNAPIYVDDTASLDIFQLRTRARRMKQQYGIALFVIDYLQLLRSENRRAENRQQEVAYISAGIKALAKELEVPVLVLSQLNRLPDQREGGKPRLSDLRESGALEQDADVVALLVREEKYADDDKKEEARGKATLSIEKQRNGPTGTVKLTFREEITRFEDRAPDTDGAADAAEDTP